MAKQLHKKFPDEQVKSLLQNYLTHEIELPYILDILGIKRRRFFYLVKKYQEDPEHFFIAYSRKKSPRSISDSIEKNILMELHIEKRFIEDKNMPIRTYNYSYIRDQLWRKYQQKVSVPTIIDKAKIIC